MRPTPRILFWLALVMACLVVDVVRAQEALPPAPKRFFNDYAGVVPAETANALNGLLEQHERDTSNQILVAIFQHLPAGAVLEDYTVRTFQAWKPGQAGRDNGAILFVFVQERRLRIEVGYGLEGVLPDAVCKNIISEVIAPHFKTGDYRTGLSQGVASLLQAAKGEYKGTGHTQAEGRRGAGRSSHPSVGLVLLFVIVMILLSRLSSRGVVYHPNGRRSWGGWQGGGWGGGGGWSGGGGFSGGGGHSGGGGASGSW